MNSFGNPGDFETHEVLGKGAYGTVYRGTNKQNGEVIALKVIDLDHPDNEDINEIQREVALLSQLRDAANHNITLYYGCWVQGMELWIAMDYASGGSIRTLMKAGPIEERFSVVIMREVLIALAYLHKENIIHRDIKAANILLTQTGRILLCDFGVAAHLSTSSKRSTFIGTPYWMAPEVITEGKMYDSKADLWSLGVTVYEVATGNPPYARMEPLRAIAMIPRTEPAKLEGDQWSAAMKEFLALCLTPDPNQRPGAEELSKSRWIRGASRVPTALLRELIVRYGGWVNAGGVRMSIIGDVARRDDTFELDMDRPSSWLFDGEDDLQLGGLGDEPYYDQRNNMNSDFRSLEDAPTARKAPAAQNNHPLMNLFKGNEDADSYGGHSHAASTSSNWVDGDTLRPNSIAIPDLDDSSSGGISLPSFDSNDSGMPAWASGGMSGWAPTSTPWYVASAMSVGKIEREDELVEPESGPTPFGQSDLSSEDGDNSSSGISIPSDLASPTTVRPAWASGAQTSFSMFSNPNPFPKRNRQASNDSLYGPGGSFGGPAVGPAFSSPPQEVEEGFRRTASPDNMLPGNRAGVSASPSLPSLTRARAAEEEDEFNTSRTLVSPSSTSPSSAQIRNRANTAPNFDANGTATKATPEEPLSKGVLNFAKASPFAQARAAMQRRPSALNIADANAASLARAQSPLTPRHGMHLSEDNLLTPMPNASPISPSQTPTTKEYPFPSVTTSPQTALTASTNIRTPLSATTTVTSSISLGDWPTGPNIAPFDYGALRRKADVQDDLDKVLGQLGDWLAIIDAGMTQILQ